MIISFGKTTDTLLAGEKTVTRRDWNPKHAAKFHKDMLIDAWNTSPRNVKGNPQKVATIRLTCDPYTESSAAFDLAEGKAEGFFYMLAHDKAEIVADIIQDWLSKPRDLYVVRFEVVS